MAIFGIIVAFAGGMYLLVTFATYTQIRALDKAALQPAPTAEPPGPADEWAIANGFVFLGNFTTKIGITNGFISAWRQPERPTSFYKYVVQAANQSNTVFDLVTDFASDVSLTTGSSSGTTPGTWSFSQSSCSLIFCIDGRRMR